MQALLNNFIGETTKADINVNYVQIWEKNQLAAWYQRVSTKARLNMWSVSKGFVSCAAGIAISENLLDLKEKIVDIFPEYVPENASEYLKSVTIEHLLTMTSGLASPLFFADSREFYEEQDWIAYFFHASFEQKPGTVWLYSNFNTYMVSCAIEKRAGMNLTEYLTPRLFTPLGIGNPIWTCCPKGHVHAANGLYLNIDELSAYGKMLLNKGSYQGRKIVPENYIEKAASKIIDNSEQKNEKQVCKGYGYGYQFLMNPEEGSFRSDGKYGQYCLVYPEKEVVIAIMSFEENTDLLEKLIWENIIRHICKADKNVRV
ncbi:MAG: serine hydrolase [Lachnospiraceae bacterium]|nr:serine hydrolase [Lachnospiraceae bacterium]